MIIKFFLKKYFSKFIKSIKSPLLENIYNYIKDKDTNIKTDFLI